MKKWNNCRSKLGKINWGHWHIAYAALFFFGMSIVMTWPFVLHMKSEVVGSIGDNVYFIWLIDWVRKAVFELHISPIIVPVMNYPAGWNLAYTSMPLAQVLLAMPASLLEGPTFGFNLTFLLCFMISGLGMYLWINHLTRSKAAGLISGTAFAFLPMIMSHFLVGHLDLVGIQWFPFYFWGLYDLIHTPYWSWKPVVMAGLSLGLIGLTSEYYLYMTLLMTIIFVLVYILMASHPFLWIRKTWANLFGFGLVAFPLLLISIIPYLQLSSAGVMPDRTISYADMYSASLSDFFLPSTLQFLLGKFIGTHFDRSMWVEGTLYIGIVVLCLAGLAWIRRRDSKHSFLIWSLAIVAGSALVLALGIHFHWFGQEVIIPVPRVLRSLIPHTSIPITLPGYYLFLYLPFFSKMRVMERFGLFVLFPITALAGMGSAWLIGQMKSANKRYLMAFLLFLLVFLDYYPRPFQTFSLIQPRPVDAWLADQPGNGAVAQFPFKMETNQEQIFDSIYNQKPFVGGLFSAFPPEQYTRIKPVMDNFPDSASISLLKQMGIKYVLVQSNQYSNISEIEKVIKSLGMHRVTIQGDEYVYEFP